MGCVSTETDVANDYFTTHKVLFLYPEVATSASFSVTSKHLGASYIRAYLKTRGITTQQYTVPGTLSLKELVDDILGRNPSFLCVTVYDCTYHTVRMIVREVKRQKPGIVVILGGPTPTFSDGVIMEDFPEADICVRGEGEYAVFELLDAFRRGGDHTRIRGLTLRSTGSGQMIRNPDRELIRGEKDGGEIDILPSPYLEGIISPSEGRSIGIITSRGCVFKCVYCNFAAMSRWSVRYHSVERVMAELACIARQERCQEPVSITIQDDAFTLDKQRAKEICRRIIDGGFKFTVDGETRADAVDEELLELMRRAGFRDLHFGVESGSPKVLRTIKKATSNPGSANNLEPELGFLNKIRGGVTEAVRLGLKPTVSIILGLPDETIVEGMESINFIASLPHCRYYHNYLEIFAGTELFETHDRYGIGLDKVCSTAVSRLYRTTPAYDLSQVPVLEERSLFNAGEQSQNIAARLCGDPSASAGDSGDRYPEIVVFANSVFADRSGSAWFLENAGSNTRLAFLWNSDGEYKDGACPNLFEVYMPLQMLYWLGERLPEADESRWYSDAFAHNGENLIPHHLRFVDAGDYACGRVPQRSDSAGIQYIVQAGHSGGIESAQDAGTLLKIYSGRRHGRNANVHCLDICRWSAMECPASGMERVVVDGNRDIYPCFSGRPVGRVGESLEVVKKRVYALAVRIRQVRGCDSCPAAKNCSKCLFPFPMSSAEFCRIQINNFI